MEGGQRALVLLLLAAGLAAGPSAALQAQSAAAAGTLTINGTDQRLTHVYVTTQPGFFDKTRDDIRVVFTTDGVSEKASADTGALVRIARAGEGQAVEVIVSADGEPMSGAIFSASFSGMVSVSGIHQFKAKRFEPRFLAGRMFMDGPRTFADVTFHYDVEFSSPIPRAPTTEEVAEALASPPGQAAAAYVATIRGREIPADSKVVALVQPTPSRATATVQGSRDGIIIESFVELVLEGGTWKVVK